MTDKAYVSTFDALHLNNTSAFQAEIIAENYLYAKVPSIVVNEMHSILHKMYPDVKLSQHYHVTLAFPRIDDGHPNPDALYLSSVTNSPLPKNKDDLKKMMILFRDKFGSIEIRFSDLMIRTKDGKLAAIEVEIITPCFPLLEQKVYHITLWSSRETFQRAPYFSNMFLEDAKCNYEQTFRVPEDKPSFKHDSRCMNKDRHCSRDGRKKPTKGGKGGKMQSDGTSHRHGKLI